MRVFIVEPSAIAFDRTHAAKSILGHSRALRSVGINVEWITNADSTLQEDEIQNHRVLTYTIYDDVRNGYTGIKRHIRFIYYWYLVQATRKKLREVFKHQQVSSADHIFVPTSDWILLQAIQLLSEETGYQNRFPVLHILIMYENANWMTGGYPYQKLIRLLKNFNLSIYFYTETERHAKRLSVNLGLKVSSYPFPCFKEEESISGRRQDCNICFLGGGRKDKGYQLVPGIISKLQRIGLKQKPRFTVQTPRPEDGLGAELEALRHLDDVLVMENRVSESAYRKTIESCAILVFPYQQNVYHARGSAIVNESVANGIPFVCTRNTSLEEMLAEDNGSSASGEEEFAMAIADIIDNYGRYHENAARMATVYQARLLDSVLIGNILTTHPGKVENC